MMLIPSSGYQEADKYSKQFIINELEIERKQERLCCCWDK